MKLVTNSYPLKPASISDFKLIYNPFNSKGVLQQRVSQFCKKNISDVDLKLFTSAGEMAGKNLSQQE